MYVQERLWTGRQRYYLLLISVNNKQGKSWTVSIVYFIASDKVKRLRELQKERYQQALEWNVYKPSALVQSC